MRNMSTPKITKAPAMITAIMTALRDTVNVVATTAHIRPLVVVALILGSFLAVWIGSPFTAERVTAASRTAIPAPTPPDQEEIDALVERLKGTLAESIDDKDAVNSIVEKWEVRALARRTKKQIITALFADVKSIVKDKETQDAVWESWSEMIAEADAEEPAAPSRSGAKPAPKSGENAEEESAAPSTPASRPENQPTAKTDSVNESTEKGINAPRVGGRWMLTDDLRRAKGDGEMTGFLLGYRAVKIWSSPETRQYRGQSYSIYVATAPVDPDARDKIAGIDKAVKTVVDNGFILPFDLRFYCTPDISTQTQAFKRGPNWAPIAYVFLGPGGSPNALSTAAAGLNGFDTRTIRTIHEIGHIIHERQAGDGYWETGRPRNTLVWEKVSLYASGNEKEFVAEVFAGILIGKRWPNEVLAEYRKFHGPVPAVF